MRIIGGRAKGSQIYAPKGQDTRPTQDRVRESLFNILQRDVQDATVLDLFAGSGALALEAVSRGASRAVVVDHAREAVQCIRRNVEKLGFAEDVRILPREYHAAIQLLAREGLRFDLVFLDPPYRMDTLGEITGEIKEAGLLQEGALVVVEHRRDGAPAMNEGFVLQSKRSYGDTEISIFQYTP